MGLHCEYFDTAAIKLASAAKVATKFTKLPTALVQVAVSYKLSYNNGIALAIGLTSLKVSYTGFDWI